MEAFYLQILANTSNDSLAQANAINSSFAIAGSVDSTGTRGCVWLPTRAGSQGPTFLPSVPTGWQGPTLFPSGQSVPIKINDNGNNVDGSTAFIRDINGNQVPQYANWEKKIGLQEPVILNNIDNQDVVLGIQGTVPSSFIYNAPYNTIPPLGRIQYTDPNTGPIGTVAKAINKHGVVVGQVQTNPPQAFFYYLSGPRQGQLHLLGAGDLCDISDHGIAVGSMGDTSPVPAWVDLSNLNWIVGSTPQFQPIALPAGFTSGGANAVNESGTIVGFMSSPSVTWPSAFISWRQGTSQDPAIDLNAPNEVDTTDAWGGKWHLWNACDINDLHAIVGEAEGSIDAQGNLGQFSFVLTPTGRGILSPSFVEIWLPVILNGFGFGPGGAAPPKGPIVPRTVTGAEREIMVGLATASLAQLLGSDQVRRQIQQAALAAAAGGVASIQRRLTQLPNVPPAAGHTLKRPLRLRGDQGNRAKANADFPGITHRKLSAAPAKRNAATPQLD